MQLSVWFEGFTRKHLPYDVIDGLEESHWITSCKVFYPLKKRYWNDTDIPQVLSTDTFIQGVYGYAVNKDRGVLLVSYTWEDDASKFLGKESDEVIAQKCLDRLEEILGNASNITKSISPYVDKGHPLVMHWSRLPTYRGCSKLYRERTEKDNYAVLRYNQEYSKKSRIYFAGEAFSVEGGWTEPALRGALDSVVHIISNTCGKFINGFDFNNNYPRYDPPGR